MVCVPLHLLLFLVHGAGAGIYPHGMCAGLTVPELRTPLVGLISALATRAAHLEERSQLVDSGAAASGPFVEAARLLVGMNARAPRRIEGDDFEAQVRLGICCVGNGPLPARIYAPARSACREKQLRNWWPTAAPRWRRCANHPTRWASLLHSCCRPRHVVLLGVACVSIFHRFGGAALLVAGVHGTLVLRSTRPILLCGTLRVAHCAIFSSSFLGSFLVSARMLRKRRERRTLGTLCRQASCQG
jgi:hypothetical protein